MKYIYIFSFFKNEVLGCVIMNEMLFIYAITTIVAFIFYYIVPLKFRWIVLLVFSLLFYVFVGKILILYVIATSIITYLTARLIGKNNEIESEDTEELIRIKKKNKRIVVLTILVNLLMIGFLKYYIFFSGNINLIFSFFNIEFKLPFIKILLPLGISFYTLQAIGYLIDIYRKKYSYEKSYFKVLLFLAFFPSIIEGPITRFDEMKNTLYEGNKIDYNEIMFAIQRILWGLFKKLIVADRVYLLVKQIGDDPKSYSGIASLLFILGYTIQLYADFSGFVDIASGTAKLFGVKLPENFKQPFFSKSVQEFWRRWHMTLGLWFKDYIFYSVALSPKVNKMSSKIRKKVKNTFTKMLPTTLALFAVWIANGLWHGPMWKYIFYGLYYFVIIFLGMMFDKIFKKKHKKLKINTKTIWYKTFQLIRTVILVLIGMTIFGANNLSDAFYILRSIFTPYYGSILNLGLDVYEFTILLIGVIAMLIMSICKEKNINLFNIIATKPV